MLQSQNALKIFEEKELNGQDCQDVLRKGFKDDADGHADICVSVFEAWFNNKIKGARNQDKQIKKEALNMCKLVISSALDLGRDDEVGLEEALNILQTGDVRVRGKNVMKLFSIFEKGSYQKTEVLCKQVAEVFDFCR